MKTTSQQTVKDAIKKIGVEFYVTLISVVTIFALALSDISDKKAKVELARIGLIQKVEGSKVIWTRP
jgi:hypothetical protein